MRYIVAIAQRLDFLKTKRRDHFLREFLIYACALLSLTYGTWCKQRARAAIEGPSY